MKKIPPSYRTLDLSILSAPHMADRKGKGILYEDDDEPIDIPEQDTSHLIQEYGLSVIGKVLNPKKTICGKAHCLYATTVESRGKDRCK